MTDPQQPQYGVPPTVSPNAPLSPEFGVPAVPPAPTYAPPAGAYVVPAGGYQLQGAAYPSGAAPVGTLPAREKLPSGLGITSLLLALVALVVPPILGAVNAWEIGYRVPGLDYQTLATDSNSLAVLSPVRDQVLWAEVSLWGGTIIGIAALVLGIIAITKRRGRGWGIGATVVSIVAPIVYLIAVGIAFFAGVSVGAIASVGS